MAITVSESDMKSLVEIVELENEQRQQLAKLKQQKAQLFLTARRMRKAISELNKSKTVKTWLASAEEALFECDISPTDNDNFVERLYSRKANKALSIEETVKRVVKYATDESSGQ